MHTLTLAVGRYYLTIAGTIVGLVSEVATDSPSFENGYRFIDQQGSLYTDKGRHADEPGIDLAREIPKSEVEDQILIADVDFKIEMYKATNYPHLELNTYYRNHRGDLVLIHDVIAFDTLTHKAGFRFVDTQGRQYSDTGVMSRWFPQFNLARLQGSVGDIPQAELDLIEKDIEAIDLNRQRRDDRRRYFKPYIEGATYGLFFTSTVRIGAWVGNKIADTVLSRAA